MNPTENWQGGSAAPAKSGPTGSSAALEDPRVVRAMEEYQAALEAGHELDRPEFLSRHPDIAPVLSECLEGLAFVHQMSPRLQPSAEDEANATPSGGDDLQPEGPLGDFRIVREIGRGGMGVVYEAVQISLGRRVALKVLPFAAAMDRKQLQRFKNESQAAAHLQHTNIVPVYYVGCERGVHFYAMQYIEGQTLAAVIRELRQSAGLEPAQPGASAEAVGSLASELASGRWAPAKQRGREVMRSGSGEQPTGPYPTVSPPHPTARPCDPTPAVAALSTERSSKSPGFFRTVAHLGVQAAEALEHAHQAGVIHRDIKPGNLLVDTTGGIWITDFGLAKLGGEPGLTLSGDLVGTLRYMSPEQALAQRVMVDARTDIYSLGVTLYELLALEPAYNGRDREEVLRQITFEEPRPPSSWNKAVPAELETIVLKAMAKNPEERYATAQELADDLRRFLEDKPIRAKRPTLWQRAAKWARRHKTVVWAAVLLLVVATIGSSVATFLIIQQRDVAEANAQRAEQILDTAYRSMDAVYLAWAEERFPQAKELTKNDRQFLENALAFYAEFANQSSSAPAGRQKTAEAYLRVATIQAQLGQDTEAKRNYYHALEAFRRLVAESPDNADCRCSLARCLSGMADEIAHPQYFDTWEETEAAFREAIKLQERLVAENATQPDYQRDLAKSYRYLGNHLGNHLQDYYKPYEEAEKLFRSAYAICTRLAEEHPTVLTYRQELCDVLGSLGVTLMNTGRLPEAERIFRESLDRRKKLVDDFPGLPYPRWCLGWGYQNLAIFFAQAETHRLEDAAESFRQAADIRAKLAADFPGVRMYQANLADSYTWLAEVWYRMDRFQEAEQAREKALAVWEVLARDYPAILDYAITRSVTQNLLGELVMDRGQSEAALALHDQAIAAMKKLLAGQPQHVRALYVLLGALGRRADALIVLGQHNELEQTYKDLEQHYEQLIKLIPSRSRDWFLLAPLYLQRGDIEGYRRVCREMLARFSQTHDPGIADETAKTCLLRPDAVSDLGPVLQLADRAITGTEQNLYYRWFLLCRGMADYRAGEFGSAIARLTEDLSLAHDRRYGSSANRDPALRDPALAGTVYVFLAMAHHRLGHADQARRALDQATQLINQMDRKTGQHTTRRTDWHNWLRFLVVYREAEQLVRSQAEALK